MNEDRKQECGLRGCSARVHPRRGTGYCLQPAIFWDEQGAGWCYYHHPLHPRRFGDGYLDELRQQKRKEVEP